MRSSPSQRAATQTSSVLATPDASATARAVSRLGPKMSMAPPCNQKGKGNQLVPLGSSVGDSAKRCAMTTRAKSSSLMALNPNSQTPAEASSRTPTSASASSALAAATSRLIVGLALAGHVDRGRALERIADRRRKVRQGDAGHEEDRPGDPGSLGQNIARAAATEHLLSRSPGEGAHAARLARLQQYHQHQEQARQDMDHREGRGE